jgi:signal recognition particle subunit SRP68
MGQDFLDELKSEAPHVEDEFLAAKLDHLILQTREKQAATLSEINWLGRTLAVKQEKVRSFLLMVQEVEALQAPKVTQLEKLLFECRDCIQMLREANQEKSPLYCYLQYLRQRLTCRRNLQMIKSLQNQSELIRPYETIIGCLNEIKSLPLEQYFNAEAEVEQFLKEVDAQAMAYKAFRCYYIGKAGKLNGKESLALLHRSSLYAAKGLSNKSLNQELRTELKELQAKAEADKFSLYANSLIEEAKTGTVDTGVKGEKAKPLVDRLDQYLEDNALASGSAPLAHFPPQFKPIPCKPLFFDLALNHVEFPSLEAEISAKGGGITGFVKGLFGVGWKK